MTFFKYVWLGALIFSSMKASEIHPPKIVVVGAGLAGLTAAYRLHQSGADVEVYEARGRVGGRILTAYVAGHIAELGAQNIADGGAAENLHRLIREFDLELVENKIILDHSYFHRGQLIPLKEIKEKRPFNPEELKAQLEQLVKNSKNMQEVLNGIFKEENDLLYKTVLVRLAAYEGGAPHQLSPLYAETLYHMLLGGLSAAHQAHQIQNHHLTLLSLKEGNHLLPEKMAGALGKRVHLHQVLQHVSKELDNSYLLTFQDGKKIKADLLVLAIPCSVFSDIAFEKQVIPPEKLEAIRKIPYGENSKIAVPVTEQPSHLRSVINNRSICFFNPDRQHIIIYSVGEASRFTEKTIWQTYDKEKLMLDMSFGNLSPQTPVYAKDQPFVSYEGPAGFSWPEDPFAKGSYSYIAPGQESVFTATTEVEGETVKTVFAPMDQKLFFAGEHASILQDVPGTMEAACESGERAARMILKTISHP